MKKTNLVVWFYSLQFLSTFKTLKYNSVPINLLLLRDFQKYILKSYKQIPKIELNQDLAANLQKICNPYLIKSNANSDKEGFTLIRANMYQITKGIDNHKFIYLAHHRKEYLQVKKHMRNKLFFYLQHLPEAKIESFEDKKLLEKLNKILVKESLNPVFKDKNFQAWVINKINSNIKLIKKVQSLFDSYPIHRIIYGSTINRHGALITTFAQTRNISTINLQHGILGELGHLPINADLNLVWGEADLNYLIKYGAPKEKFRIIGPYFFRSTAKNSLSVSKTEDLKNKYKVLVALQPLGFHYNKKLISTIEKAIEPFSNKIYINYKLHPDQNNISKYRKYLINNNSQILADSNNQLSNLIHSSDLVITPFSTVAYESMVYNKPVVFYGRKEYWYYLEGEPTYVYNILTIKNLFYKVINDNSYLTELKNKVRIKDSYQKVNNQQRLWEAINQLELANIKIEEVELKEE